MSATEDPAAETADDFPAAPPLPWRLDGSARLGVFTLAQPMEAPSTVTAVAARRLLVFANSYRGGDVSYDALGVATLARHRHRVAVVPRHLWVDDPSIRRAGREQASTPSDPGSFAWSDSSARIASGQASVELSWHVRTRLALPMPMTFTYFVWDDGRLGCIPIPGRATGSPITMRINHWPDHFPELAAYESSLALRLNFAMTVRPQRLIDSK
ncbi:hypothetical protein [Streptomyces nojiriensis]|uniref:hypothetical protein n=1 Tax=Streptomyces nojiriensis TaxID=66374 RepID=UPI0035D8B400